MCAVVWSPSGTLLSTVKVTTAPRSPSATSVTLPTLIPETLTSLPVLSPPASANSAWYLTAVAHEASCSGCSPTATTNSIEDDAKKPHSNQFGIAILEH